MAIPICTISHTICRSLHEVVFMSNLRDAEVHGARFTGEAMWRFWMGWRCCAARSLS